MAMGDVTLTNKGTFDISGAALKTAVDSINSKVLGISGAGLFFVPTDPGQVQVLQVEVAAA